MVKKTLKNESYIIISGNQYKYLWRGERSYRYFIKELYDAYPDSVNSNRLNVDGIIFKKDNTQYYIEI